MFLKGAPRGKNMRTRKNNECKVEAYKSRSRTIPFNNASFNALSAFFLHTPSGNPGDFSRSLGGRNGT
ncbi:hypothetical protein LIER_39623 [Lithospermum erythrorhizon]|uniref:Uncharacterized protein n=1 Tax=Lithospermum erythrorhizon TaxID=34254 RepID=A0AAV3QKA5_LITER